MLQIGRDSVVAVWTLHLYWIRSITHTVDSSHLGFVRVQVGKTDSYTHSTIDEINTDVTELIAKHSYIMIGLYFVSVLFN